MYPHKWFYALLKMTAVNSEGMGMNIHYTVLEGAKSVIFIIFFFPCFKLTFGGTVSAGVRISLPRVFINCSNVNLQTATITSSTITKLISLMSDLDASFKVKAQIILHKWPGNEPQLDGQLEPPFTYFNLHLVQPDSLVYTCLCVHNASVSFWICLYVWPCVGERQWQGCSARYKNSHPDRPGLGVRVGHVKTQTVWVCNVSEERSWCHTALSGLKRQTQPQPPSWNLLK